LARLKTVLLIALFIGAISGCSSIESLTGTWSKVKSDVNVSDVNISHITIDDAVQVDESFYRLLYPYKMQLDKEMKQPLTVLKEPLEMKRGELNSSLANVLSDQLRSYASVNQRRKIDIAVINRGGIRLPTLSDTVKVETIFELMPFENTMVLLPLKGAQVLNLANELAAIGGEAVSGLRFSIKDGKAENILVGSHPIQDDTIYWVVTNNYLVEGGGDMPSLWNNAEAIFTEIKIRDIYMQAFSKNSQITPVDDDRVREDNK
jgi:2',3'-cyclic-nucleotide 2'-phosphodiesterase (5'-nucleotidase family)